MNEQEIQVSENVSYICSEVKVSDYFETKRMIDPFETLILFLNGDEKEIFKGPVVVNLDEYQKKVKDNHKDELELYFINEKNLIFETKRNILTFKSYDFIYRILITLNCEYSYKLIIEDYHKFIEILSPKKNKITYSYLTDLITPRVEHSIRKSLLSLLKNKKSTFFESVRYLSEISNSINEDLSSRNSDLGVKILFSLESLDYVDNDSVNKLKSIILKSKEMELLDYSYQQENLIDFIQIVEEKASKE